MNSENKENLSNYQLFNVYRDLGFMVASDLTWKVHVDSIAKKANRLLGYIKRTYGFKAPVQAKKLLYLTHDGA